MQFTIKPAVPDLCVSCRHSHTIETVRDTRTFCQVDSPHREVQNVRRCNEYQTFTAGFTPWEYKDLAWNIEVKGTKFIGFKPPKKEKDFFK